MSDSKFFKRIIIPLSFVAGIIFILRHILIFIKVYRSGEIYSFFSFINPDPLIIYAPFVRAIYDGATNLIDGRIFYTTILPNLWSPLAPILIVPFFYITRSLSGAFVLGHFVVASLSFIIFYFLAVCITKHRLFSILYSFILISATLLFSYLLPTSLDHIKLVARTILPIGSPPGEIVLSKYVSFSILPALPLFFLVFLLIYLAIIRNNKFFIIAAGINLSILFYLVITDAIYVSAALFAMLVIFVFTQDAGSVKKIICIYLIGFLGSIVYWINFLQIKFLPHQSEFYRRLGGELTHSFRLNRWLDYVGYCVMVILILLWGKKYNRQKEAAFASGGVIAAFLIFNMQVITGYNPAPGVWEVHQFFLGFAIGWLVILYWLFSVLKKKFNARLVSAIFCVIFLMIIGKIIYTEYFSAQFLSAHHYIPKNIYKSLTWLNTNTPKDSVVVTPSLVTNALLPALTHNNSMLPVAVSSPLSLKDIEDRYLLTFKLFGVKQEYFESALRGKLSDANNLAFAADNGLQTWMFDAYYYDTSLNASINNHRVKSAPEDVIQTVLANYINYSDKFDQLVTKYRTDFLYVGPYERQMGIVDFVNSEQVKIVYDQDGVTIYKLLKK